MICIRAAIKLNIMVYCEFCVAFNSWKTVVEGMEKLNNK